MIAMLLLMVRKSTLPFDLRFYTRPNAGIGRSVTLCDHQSDGSKPLKPEYEPPGACQLLELSGKNKIASSKM